MRAVIGATLALCVCAEAAHARDKQQPRTNVLPPELIGRWVGNLGDCADRISEVHMTVTPRSVEFYASIYDIRRVTKRGERKWRGTGRLAGEGETETTPGKIDFELVSPDEALVTTGDPDNPETYRRCKSPPTR